MSRELRGSRYLTHKTNDLASFIVGELPSLDYRETLDWYAKTLPTLDDKGMALLGCNDRYYLLGALLGRWRPDPNGGCLLHPWLFDRCREVEADPDNHLDLWARYHWKSSIGTHAGLIQEILCDPEITICILSATRDIATAFLTQIQQEFENNDLLKQIYPDVLWADPRKEAARWSRDKGIVVKRRGNPKEATVEAWGLIDGQPTSRHYKLLNYDDVVTQDVVGSPEMNKKVTERWELSDNLGTTGKTRKWHWGTRYAFGDTYGVIIERSILKERIYPATGDGRLNGAPVLMSPEKWAETKNTQRSTVAAQMLLDPRAGSESTFLSSWFHPYDVLPPIMNVYIMVDPSMGKKNGKSDRTAIAVIGVDVGGNKYLLDGYRHRMKFSERYGHMRNAYVKWRDHIGVQMVRVGYERYGQQVDLEVIQEYQAKENLHFAIEELNFPREGQHSKIDRIRRLEPDMSKGRFYLPGVVWHPDMGNTEHRALWKVWTAEDVERAEKEKQTNYALGHILYRPLQGETRAQRAARATSQKHRIVDAVMRRDEDGNTYDLTRVFMEEAMFHPFFSHDDLVDAVSRIYDMEPKPAIQFEDRAAEPVAYRDS